ncbi:putative LRR receptor-like serine/threonine-protein kinase RKF3 [Heracleum sosnowskyi]|uniref:LRR receptor-like serine/threonine-protein kinase RKF3 n=1 Tax=Heracleum sosnowskyi TaxID=360622 RepID=A0AAD8J9H3_9APIA|nr:putative LRR receptor-like serine/threonine-protein kinase RKF3 [Heracleum sosnowskyi]
MSQLNTPLLFVFISSFLLFFHSSLSQQNDTVSCPLDFEVLRRLTQGYMSPSGDQCQFILEGLRLVQSDYLKRTDSFLPRVDSAEACWKAYQDLYDQLVPGFDIRKNCGFKTEWISQGCGNITSRVEYEANNSPETLAAVSTACNQSLVNSSPCATCTTSLSSLQPSDPINKTVGNVSDCTAYRSIYAAAFANSFGPDDKGNAECLFSLNFTPVKSSNKQKKAIIVVVVVLGVLVLVLCGSAAWLIRRNKLKKKIRQREITRRWSDLNMNNSALESINGSTTLIRFTFDDIKEATKNFSRFNIIGRGGYGNVYKGVLPDGSEAALKRFKNCSAAGDASFAHEVEVIASVRHVNLVALRGYCTATTNFEGHQRIIVCDLVKNGSLHDHLFGSIGTKLSWPLTERSDVYSFGVVLLELLSGKKALIIKNDAQHTLVADWAWGLVRNGRALEVIEEGLQWTRL